MDAIFVATYSGTWIKKLFGWLDQHRAKEIEFILFTVAANIIYLTFNNTNNSVHTTLMKTTFRSGN